MAGTPVARRECPLLKAQVDIEYENGKKELIVADGSWRTSHGPIIEADILIGETYNANLESGH
jgi:alpha-L-rhamnosidase